MPSSSRPKRVYHRDWKLQTRTVRGSVSLPRLHLISSSRPLFECPSCYSCNDRVPICLWCKSTNPRSAAAFWESMPKQRTVSAPMKVTWSYIPVTGVPGRAKSAETVSAPPSRTTPSAHSISSHSSRAKSHMLASSTRTSATTTTEAITSPASPTVDEIGRIPPVNPCENTSQQKNGKFHTLPLRRKGHILRTTAGMVVNKSRLSALFRKDAVPVLDKVVPSEPQPVKSRPTSKLRTSTNLNHGEPRPARQKQSTLTALPSLPTIPDASVPSPSPNVAGTYTTPTPPSFLSPFWYRPEEYSRLPASVPSSRPASIKTSGPVIARSRHAHTRSEPFSMPGRVPGTVGDPSPNAWKRRMSGFLRHSISVVSGHKAIH